jgi:hypothetical protein
MGNVDSVGGTVGRSSPDAGVDLAERRYALRRLAAIVQIASDQFCPSPAPKAGWPVVKRSRG